MRWRRAPERKVKAVLIGMSLAVFVTVGLVLNASQKGAIPTRFTSRASEPSSAPWDPSPCVRDPAHLPIPTGPTGFPTNYLHTCGGQLYDAAGHLAQITGVSWFGFETGTFAPHGLDRRNWRSLLDQVATLGFNTLRVPYTNEMLQPNARVSAIDYLLNPDLRDLTPLELLDRLIAGARERGLRVILDRHRPDSSGQSPLWYTEEVSEAQWIADWRMLAARYRGNDTVVGVDLHNEPKDQATWGSDDPLTDWRLAAERAGNAILQENPYLLVFVQGIQWSPWVSYWWGGNLESVRDHPVRLQVPNRVVYSPHDYGPAVFPQPWFWDADFPDNLVAIWDQYWGYLTHENIAPVVVGEFGDRSVGPDRDGMWQRAFVDYLQDNHIGYLHWALNPDSSDTGGILADDWRTVRPERLALLSRYLAQPLAAGTAGVLGPPREALSVLVSDGVKDDNGLRFDIWLRNEGPEAVPFSRLELRYWFDVSGSAAGLRVSVDGRDIPGGEVLSELVADGTAGPCCLRLTFGDQHGAIAAYRDSGKISVSIAEEGVSGGRTDNQSSAEGLGLGTDSAFALYRDGELVWGRPPDGQTIAPPVRAASPGEKGLPTPQGSRFWAGVNYSLPLGADIGGEAGPSHPGTAAVIDADFANFAAAGVRVIKLHVFGPASLQETSAGQQGEFDEILLADLDTVLSLADRHGLRLIFSLFDLQQGPAECVASETSADDLLHLLADPDRWAALMAGAVFPFLDRTAGDPHVLAYEIISQPPGGWGTAEASVRDFVQETAQAIHARGQALATVLTGEDDLPLWSDLGLDYYSVRWVAQSAAEPLPEARVPPLDRPLVVGEFALHSPGYGVSGLLSLALAQGYAGAFISLAEEDNQLLWRGDYLAWVRRHWLQIGYSEGDPPLPGQPLQISSYGIDHLRLRADDHDLYADLYLRVGRQEERQIVFALRPIGAGDSAAIADSRLSLSSGQSSHLGVWFPSLTDGQAYQLVATLWDDHGGLLAQFGELASFVMRQNNLTALDGGDDGGCRGAARVVPLVRSTPSATGDSQTGRVESLDGAEPPAEIRNLPPGVRQETVVDDADTPVAMAFTPDGRLFFGELHTGQVRIVDREGRLQREPFLTLAVSGQPQAGLLGIAIDPEFRRNHYVYVLYTASRDGHPGGLNGPNRLIRATEAKGRGMEPVVLVDNLPSAFILNGGGLRFGPDGNLYVGIGAGENRPAAADPSSLAGKVLRYRADGAVPGEGVFKNGQPAVYAVGIASAFGLAFHPLSGELYATDASGETDKLDLVVSGSNPRAAVPSDPHNHRGNDALITYWPPRQISGLDFYRNSRIREWQNDAFFCNARRREMHRVRLSPPGFDRVLSDDIVLTGCQFAVVSGPDGALYYSNNRGIYRLAKP